MYLVRAYSRNSRQHLILARKGTFFYEKRALFIKRSLFMKKGTLFEKRAPNILPLLFNQNKAWYNFRKRGQRSIVKRNIERNIV